MSETTRMALLDALKVFAKRRLPPAVVVEIQKHYYPRHVRQFSEIDQPDVAIVRRLVAPGDCVVDAGAHVGWYSRVLSEAVGPRGSVYSLEPIPSTFRILTHCVRRLRLFNVRPMQCGLSDVDRETVMFVPEQQGSYNFYQSSVSKPALTGRVLRFPVQLRTIDTILPGPADISFIKCDVEGHDLEALTGGMRLLRRCTPSLMVEMSDDPDLPGSRAQQLCSMLAELGYSPWWYDGAQLRRRVKGEHPDNFFFLTVNHLSRLIEQGTPVEVMAT